MDFGYGTTMNFLEESLFFGVNTWIIKISTFSLKVEVNNAQTLICAAPLLGICVCTVETLPEQEYKLVTSCKYTTLKACFQYTSKQMLNLSSTYRLVVCPVWVTSGRLMFQLRPAVRA
jgi:hypothetical protein